MALAIETQQGPVSVDHDQAVEIVRALALEDGDGQHHAQLGCQGGQGGDAGVLAPGVGLGEPALLLGDAEIGALEELGGQDDLGARKVLWLGDGLQNDHTDGHVDNLARFAAPGVVVCPMAFGRGDPNAEVYDAAAEALAGMTDAAGRRLRVVRIPSPGWIEAGGVGGVPASHMNFIIANQAVILPVYGEGLAASLAAQGLAEVFPDRKIIPLTSNALLTGGGSFHCISQQEPA